MSSEVKAASSLYQSKYGYHVCSPLVYQQLRIIRKAWFQAQRDLHKWYRWTAKAPHNRVTRMILRNDKGQPCGSAIAGTMPEPRLCKLFVVRWLATTYYSGGDGKAFVGSEAKRVRANMAEGRIIGYYNDCRPRPEPPAPFGEHTLRFIADLHAAVLRYTTTQHELAKFVTALADCQAKPQPCPILAKAEEESLKSMIDDLTEQLAEFLHPLSNA